MTLDSVAEKKKQNKKFEKNKNVNNYFIKNQIVK